MKLNIITLQTKHVLFASPTDTIRQLKHQIMTTLGLPFGTTRLRLIFRGRVLDADNNTLASCSITDSANLHCSIIDSVVVQQMQQENSHDTDESVEEEDRRGFDRLRDYGFSVSEIESFRSQFHQSRFLNSGFLLSSNNNQDYLRQIEEEWMNTNSGDNSAGANSNSNNSNNNDSNRGEEGNNPTNVRVNDNNNHYVSDDADELSAYGSHADMFKGMTMGFVLGFIMLLWLPDQSLPLKTKIGIVLGLFISFSFGVLRAWIHV